MEGDKINQNKLRPDTPRSDLIGHGVKNMSVVMQLIAVRKTLTFSVVFSLFMVYCMIRGMPLYIGMGAILFLVIFLALEVLSLRQISAVTVDIPPQSNALNERVSVDQGETIQFTVAGIMDVSSLVRGVEILGAGQIKSPQNALIITNSHVHVITVPLAGAGQMIQGEDISMLQWLVASKEIDSVLQQMILTMPLASVLQCHPQNYSIARSAIAKVDSSNLQQKFTFKLSTNKKYSYTIREKVDFEKLKQTFANTL